MRVVLQALTLYNTMEYIKKRIQYLESQREKILYNMIYDPSKSSRYSIVKMYEKQVDTIDSQILHLCKLLTLECKTVCTNNERLIKDKDWNILYLNIEEWA